MLTQRNFGFLVGFVNELADQIMDLESTVFESKLLLEARAYLKLAVPYTITQLSEAIITFVDTVMIGLLGSEALAAAALGVVNFFTLLFLSKGVLETVSVFAAEAFGAEKPEQVKRITSQGIWLGFAIAVPMMLIVWHLDVVLLLIGQDESLVLLAKPYLQAVVWSFPAAMELMDKFSQQLQLEGRSEEILLDYRLALIDLIAHLCEMYRRSIPRKDISLDLLFEVD